MRWQACLLLEVLWPLPEPRLHGSLAVLHDELTCSIPSSSMQCPSGGGGGGGRYGGGGGGGYGGGGYGGG